MRKYVVISFVLVFTACVKDKPSSISQPQVQLSSAKKVYIVNEGNFGSGNSSVSLYDPETGSVIEDFYYSQNNSHLGDVAQSMNFINGRYYVVVNNSNKIMVCNEQLKITGKITGLRSPRYILPLTNQKAYVTDLYSDSISIVDLSSNSKRGGILCKGKTERMILIYNKAFVTNTESDYVYVINTITDAKMDSVVVGKNASGVVLDKNDKIWVLSGGESQKSAGRLTKIDPVSLQVQFALSFSSSDYPGYLCQNKTKDTLYFLNSGIFRMAINESQLPVNAFIPNGAKNFYGLGVSSSDYMIYAADAIDYSQKSNIYVFAPSGEQRKVFKAGFLSNGFYFE